MTRTTIQANGRQYLFSPDDEPPLSSRIWALLRVRLLNDVTGEPIRGGLRIESDLVMTLPRITEDGVIRWAPIPLAVPRVTADGLVGLAAIPSRVFPILAGRNYTVNLTFHATGYISRTVAVTIPNDQRLTVNPLPQAGDRIMSLNNTANFIIGETLMVGNPVTNPGSRFEQVRIAALGPGPNQVTIRNPLAQNHNVAPEPVVPVISANFGPTDVVPGVRMVPQP